MSCSRSLRTCKGILLQLGGLNLKRCNLYWMPGFQTATVSPLNAYFAWGRHGGYEDDDEYGYNSDMSEADARMTLEHYVDWK